MTSPSRNWREIELKTKKNMKKKSVMHGKYGWMDEITASAACMLVNLNLQQIRILLENCWKFNVEFF